MPLHPAEDVPAEMWLQILQDIDAPADFNSVIRTCRNLYSYGIQSLHRNILWRSPHELANNLPTYTSFPAIAADVRSLEIHISTLPYPLHARFVSLKGEQYDGPVLSWSDIPLYFRSHNWPLKKCLSYYKLENRQYASNALYKAMVDQVHKFTNISSLTFRDLLFSTEFVGAIHALPALRKLHIELCLFPSGNNGQVRDHSALPITELTLLNLRRVHAYNRHTMPRDDHVPHPNHPVAHNHPVVHHNFRGLHNLRGRGQGRGLHQNNPFLHPNHPIVPQEANPNLDDDILHVLRLALAHNLHTLRIDCTADVPSRVYTRYNPVTQQTSYHVPAALRRLYSVKKRYFPFEHQPTLTREQAFPSHPLYHIFRHALDLEAVSICSPLPRNTTFPPTMLPNLRFVEAVPDALVLLIPGRPIEAVSVLWCESSVTNTLNMLGTIAQIHPGLHMLAVECGVWDDEVLHAACMLFPQLRRLKITWIGGGPTEDTVVSLGPQFISRLEHLHTLQFFHAPKRLVHTTPPAANDLQGNDVLILKPSPYFDPKNPAHQNQMNMFSPPYPKTLFDDTFGGIEEELRDLLIPWNRFCKNLRVVQLCEGWRMKKDCKGGNWMMEKVREVYEEDFSF